MDFRLIVTQVVYDREAQIGEKTISPFVRLGNTADKNTTVSQTRHSGLPPQVATYTTTA